MHTTVTLLVSLAAGAIAGPLPASDAASKVQVAHNSTTAPVGDAANSNSWAMQTWSGTSCAGQHFYWSAPDGYSCTNLGAVSSLKVTNFGGCSTYYYTGSGCNGSPVHVTNMGCDGYSLGERIESFSVQC